MPRPATGKTPGHNVRVPDDLWRAAMALARQRGETITDVIVRALKGYVRRYGNTEDAPVVKADDSNDQ